MSANSGIRIRAGTLSGGDGREPAGIPREERIARAGAIGIHGDEACFVGFGVHAGENDGDAAIGHRAVEDEDDGRGALRIVARRDVDEVAANASIDRQLPLVIAGAEALRLGGFDSGFLLGARPRRGECEDGGKQEQSGFHGSMLAARKCSVNPRLSGNYLDIEGRGGIVSPPS